MLKNAFLRYFFAQIGILSTLYTFDNILKNKALLAKIFLSQSFSADFENESINASLMKIQIFHKKKYDFKAHIMIRPLLCYA